jgi:hypothetical protein
MAAESIELNAGSGGSSVATDEVGGLHYQMVKLAAGGDGEAQFAASNHYTRSAAGSDQDATGVKNGYGAIYDIEVFNTNTSVRYLKIYNVYAPTSASTPHQVFAVPGSGGVVVCYPRGRVHSVGIGFRLTTGGADNDANAVASGEMFVNIGYV